MGYLLAGLLVLLIVATAVTLAVRSARRQGRGAADDPAIVATDRETPLGDTPEHAEVPR